MYSVLIVEDEDIIRMNLTRYFDWSALGCSVCCACTTGEEGLAAISEFNPDIVLADIHLPGMSGIEMLEKASEACCFNSIIITGYSSFEYARRAIRLSVADYILKPIDEELLKKAALKAIARIKEKKALESLNNIREDEFSIDRYSRQTDDIYLSKLYSIIKERYTDYLKLEEIGSEIGLSSGYLSRKLKQETGMSFLSLLQQHRVEVARNLISRNPNLKFYEIAEMVGFSSYKRFSEVFRKYSGDTAKSIHKSNKNDNSEE